MNRVILPSLPPSSSLLRVPSCPPLGLPRPRRYQAQQQPLCRAPPAWQCSPQVATTVPCHLLPNEAMAGREAAGQGGRGHLEISSSGWSGAGAEVGETAGWCLGWFGRNRAKALESAEPARTWGRLGRTGHCPLVGIHGASCLGPWLCRPPHPWGWLRVFPEPGPGNASGSACCQPCSLSRQLP